VIPAALEAEPEEMTIGQGMSRAFSYPFRRSGAWMLLSGAIALTLTYDLAVLAKFALVIGLVLMIIMTVVVTGFFFEFITTFCVEFLTLYLLIVTARVLGVMYYVRRQDLNWSR
jgi:hypothetical protein